MDASFNPVLTRLHKGAVSSHVGERGRGVAVFEGRVWVTQDHDLRDFVLGAGDSFAIERRGQVVVEALSDASLLFFDDTDDVVEIATSVEPAWATL